MKATMIIVSLLAILVLTAAEFENFDGKSEFNLRRALLQEQRERGFQRRDPCSNACAVITGGLTDPLGADLATVIQRVASDPQNGSACITCLSQNPSLVENRRVLCK